VSSLSSSIGRLDKSRAGFVYMPKCPNPDAKCHGAVSIAKHQRKKFAVERWMVHMSQRFKQQQSSLDRLHVAKIHFPPSITHLFDTKVSSNPKLKMSTMDLSLEMGKIIGLTDTDLNPVTSKSTYILVPNWTVNDAMKELADLQVQPSQVMSKLIGGSGFDILSPSSSSSSSPHGTLSEHDIRSLRVMKRKAACDDQGDHDIVTKRKLEALQLQLSHSQEHRIQVQEELINGIVSGEADAALYESFIDMCGGLSRWTLMSAAWHKKHPMAAKHFLSLCSICAAFGQTMSPQIWTLSQILARSLCLKS
jgi:hypothetical protein